MIAGLADRIATHILAFAGNGEVVWRVGNYLFYIEDATRCQVVRLERCRYRGG